jgi:hypothetical protein
MDSRNAAKLAAGTLLVGASLLSGNAALITAAGGIGVNWTSAEAAEAQFRSFRPSALPHSSS